MKQAKRILAIVLSALLALGMFAIGASASTNDFAAEVLRLVNVERANHGLHALSGANANLNAAAQVRAVELETYFSPTHNRPDGRAWYTVFQQFPVNRTRAAENIARGQTSPQAVVTAWMGSAGHRVNILDAGTTHMGVGVHQSGGRLYWVQLFITDPSTPANPGPCASNPHVDHCICNDNGGNGGNGNNNGGSGNGGNTIFCTRFESNFWNWLLFIVGFGWIWMWFV